MGKTANKFPYWEQSATGDQTKVTNNLASKTKFHEEGPRLFYIVSTEQLDLDLK